MAGTFIPYQELEHTADVGIRAWGRSPEELFANAARGMAWLCQDAGDAPGDTDITLEAEGIDREHLLVRWLSAVLGKILDGWTFTDYQITLLIKNNITAVCRARKLGGRDVIKKEIKLVTHHGLKIIEHEGTYSVEVIFDV